MDSPNSLAFDYNRRYGVEIEVNSTDGRDFRTHPLGKGELPKGIHYVGSLVSKILKTDVQIVKWGYTNNNEEWVVKPDSSCGIEICSPTCKGWYGLKNICKVIEGLAADKQVKADSRCSLHVHVEVRDCSKHQIAKILTYWIKSEAVFLDSVPFDRKRNRFCQCIGACPEFSHNEHLDVTEFLHKMGAHKYYTANVFQMIQKGRRSTIEFRIIGAEGCVDAYLVKNWVRLLVHFVEMAKSAPTPTPYRHGDRWSSLLWLDPKDVMDLLGFTGEYELSKGMYQTRNWFLARLWKNLADPRAKGIWCADARSVAKEQVRSIIRDSGLKEDEMDIFVDPPHKRIPLYAKDFKF